MSESNYPRIFPASDASLLVEFGNTIDYGINDKVYALQRAIESSDLQDAIVELIPSYRSLLIEYDPIDYSYSKLQERVGAEVKNVLMQSTSAVASDDRVHEIPVIYGGTYGPDLETVANHNGLSTDEVISIHSGTDYHIFMLGFAPGFPYLGGLDERIACPRLATPRTLVPAGSVGIAESQTGVYPNPSPGGWQLIGRTPIALFDVNADPPAAMLPGAKVNFVPISYDEYEEIVNSR